ncbi:MAG: hypothetical protein PHW63_05315 [Alphaproteobacteria bacterium]|nr:hypothetical protein [Alphaproteobacteria bacterium]
MFKIDNRKLYKRLLSINDCSFDLKTRSLGLVSNEKDSPLAINNVTIVGAIYRRCKTLFGAYKGLICERDKVALTQSLLYAQQSGYTFGPKIRVTVSNLAYGNDFLDTEKQKAADLVICSYIYDPPKPQSEIDADIQQINGELFLENASISKEHHTENAWHKAVVASGARLVTTFVQKSLYERQELTQHRIAGEHIRLIGREDVTIRYENGLTGHYEMQVLGRK